MQNIITIEFYIWTQKLPFIWILASKINFSIEMKYTNLDSLESLLLSANNILIMIEKLITVEFCVKCHHVYQSKWEAKVDSELKICHRTRPGALVEDKYIMVLKHKDVNVEHVQKFPWKIRYFYLKHEWDLLLKIIGKKEFLRQGGWNLHSMFSSLQAC